MRRTQHIELINAAYLSVAILATGFVQVLAIKGWTTNQCVALDGCEKKMRAFEEGFRLLLAANVALRDALPTGCVQEHGHRDPKETPDTTVGQVLLSLTLAP